MTDDKRVFDADGMPQFPWRLDDGTIYAADDQILLVVTAPVGGEVVDSMNMLAEDGWFRPITAAQEELYNAYVRSDSRVQAALSAIEKFRKDGTISVDSPGVQLETPAEMLDVLHDVLSGGGSMTYFPCRYPVIPDVGEDGMCVAHDTDEHNDVRYCKPHADALRAATSAERERSPK